jgi:DNA repair exonuclease SbcCD ATPase subunit
VRIESLEIAGWMPFSSEFRLALPAGPIAIVGMHGGDGRRSNRAGKTSLLEAITWCLYGVHRKRLDDAIINRSCDECQVTVNLGWMRVTRSRARGRSTKLVVADRDVLADKEITLTGIAAQQYIEDVLARSLEDYLATSCFRQGDVDSIISRTAGERLTLVSEWLQQSKWIDARRIQSARASAVDTALAEKRATRDSAAGYVLGDEKRTALEWEVAELDVAIRELREQGGDLSTQLAEAASLRNQLQLHRDLRGLRHEVQTIRTKLKGRAELDAELAAAQQRESELAVVANEAAHAMRSLQRARAEGFDGHCPVTCEQCPVRDTVNETLQKATDRFTAAREASQAASAEWAGAKSEVAALRIRVAEFDRNAARYQSLVARGKEIAAGLTATEEEAEAAPSAQPIQLQLEALRAEVDEKSRRLGELQAMLRNDSVNVERHKTLEAELVQAQRQSKVSHLALSAIAAVPARIAAEQLGELEAEANVLLAGTGVSLRFSWARELADKASVCDACGYIFASKRGDECAMCQAPRGKKRAQELELLCDDGSGVEEDVRYNSGGTRAIVGAAVRLAASAMLRRLRPSASAWAIVDEPFGSLDAENREQLAQTFSGMLGSVGFEQALVVSHDPYLLAALPHRIVIDKDGGTSTVRLE